MSDFLFAPWEPVSVAVAGSDRRYAVRRIFCVGRNYAAHAREMGFEPDREEPFYFTKIPAAIVASGAAIPYPPGTGGTFITKSNWSSPSPAPASRYRWKTPARWYTATPAVWT